MALVELKVYTSTGEARVVQAKLEARGIPTFLFDEHSGFNMIPYGGLFCVRLMVPKDRIDEATRLLEKDTENRPRP